MKRFTVLMNLALLGVMVISAAGCVAHRRGYYEPYGYHHHDRDRDYRR